jgi:hypothetical protein
MSSKNLSDRLKFVAQTAFLVPAVFLGVYASALFVKDFWIRDCFEYKEQVTNIIGEGNYEGFRMMAPIIGIGGFIFSVVNTSYEINRGIDKFVNFLDR